MLKSKYARLYILVAGLYAGTAFGVAWDPPTDTEIAMLPAYCATKFKNLPDYGHWVEVLGPSFNDVHHYCGALVYLNRYYTDSNPNDRKFFLQDAIGNLDYMISHALPTQPRNVLLPEVHYTKGRVLILAGRASEAVGEFLQAIQLKPDYADPYAALADSYSRIGHKQDALKILGEGLKQVPASRSLARRYRELGGKNPLPASPPPTATPAEGKNAGVKTDANAPVQPAVSIPTPASEGAATPVAAQPAPAAEDSPKIGSPTNPYCRFCP